MNVAGKIKTETYHSFKSSTTVFTLQLEDYKHIEDFKKAIEKVWTVTPFVIITPDQLGNYMKEGYSIFSFSSLTVQQQTANNNTFTYPHFYYDLWLPEVKKNKVKEHYLARIAIYVDGYSYHMTAQKAGLNKKNYSSTMALLLYRDAIMYSWSAGMLSGYLKEVNDALINQKERGPFTGIVKREELKSLKTDTLYIPDFVFLKHNRFTGLEKEIEIDEAELKNRYPYPFKIVTKAELNERILSGQSIKYLLFIKNNTDKFINVYDSKTGGLLFAKYVKLSANFRPKDLGLLKSEIK